jgi:hypothetical protein
MFAHLIARRLLGVGCLIAWSMTLSVMAGADVQPDIARELKSGHFKLAQESLRKYLSDHPENDLARFQLGGVEFFAAIEGLAQDSYRYGLEPNVGIVPFLRTPIKPNPHPQSATYDNVRQMIGRFIEKVEQAEATLAPITDKNLQWNLDITAVGLDMNGDGQADPDETLWSVFNRFALREPQAPPNTFTIGLDAADVHWLRGYCHLLSALGDLILAYDHQQLFDRTAQLFFANPETPYTSVLVRHGETAETRSPWNEEAILDAVAFIHLARFPLKEPERLAKARERLLAMIESSRKSWELIERETDNSHEWIPGPNQTSVVEGVAINQERFATWRRFLDEGEAVLNGQKLIPFWRGNTGQGVNLMKVLTAPKDFDLVLWVQGSDAVPYLDKGEMTSPQTWREFQRVFQGRFVGMAIWIN